MQKKILIFSLTYYPRPIGGAEVAIKEITDRISDIEFHLIALRFDSTLPKEEKIGNVCVHRIGFTKDTPSAQDLLTWPLQCNKFFFPLLSYLTAVRLHRKHQFTGIWAMMAAFAGFGALFFKLSHPKIPYLLTLQEGDPIEYILAKVRFVRPLFVRIFTKADMVQVISEYLAGWGRRMGYTGPLEIVPNAVDTKHFSQIYPQSELDDLKEKLGKKLGDIFLITTSRLVKKNACDDVIRALSLLPPNIRFLVLGEGPDKGMLEHLAASEGVTERVTFLGQVSHQDMPKYLKAADIFIRPSRSEGMGNSFVEAMAAELPVIATQEGGIADFLFDAIRNPQKEATGFAVDRDNPDQIKIAVDRILGDTLKTQKTVLNAKAMVLQSYDWDLIAMEMYARVFTPLLQ